ncbi:disease resistance protein ADR1-like [Phoenix dactylifera]|uniref:Disease resistance protein ADR1-like n=1 Tax=Phoenix dactylifera TaxID=42345 RepID=A0A8B8J0J5_PHODC|nr:disease resistance protein ADR1-like [Phoenix dactylifera]
MTMPELPSLKSLKMKGTNKQLGLICNLTTLSSFSIGVNKTSNGTESPPFVQKKMTFRYFRSLENLVITASEDLTPLLDEEEETRGLSTSLHSLGIESCNWIFSPPHPLAFWKNLTSLLSLMIYHCDDLVYWPEAEFRGLNSLKNMVIYGCNKLVGPLRLPLSSSSSGDGELLPNLEVLNIYQCDGLLELPKLPASLRSLLVTNCPKINSLTEGLRHATALESVRIWFCPSLTSLPVDLGHLTALKMMSIRGLPGLESFPQGLRQLAALKGMQIINCSKLLSLPEGMQGLTALQDLCISNCPLLSSLPEGCNDDSPALSVWRL